MPPYDYICYFNETPYRSYFRLIICNDIGNSSHLLDDLRMKSSGLQLEKFVLNLMHSQLFHRLMNFASDKFHEFTLNANHDCSRRQIL